MARRLRPIRVLLVGRDRRFARVTRLLLERSGCEVDSIESSLNLPDVVRERRINVVLVDASGAITATARSIAALEAQDGHTGIIVVAEHPKSPTLETLPLLPKWGDYENLLAHVEAAYAGAGAQAAGWLGAAR